MRNKGLISLLAVTLAAVAIAIYVGQSGETPQENPLVGTSVLPEVGKRIDDVGRVALVHGGVKTTLVRRGKGWVVEEKSDYPANDTKVNQALLGLAGITYVEMKTRTPALYPRLDVEDADKKDAKSTLVTIADAKGSLLGELIVGKSRIDQLGGGNDGVYVRKPGGAQSWLARGTLDLSGDTTKWLDTSLLDLPEAKVKDVVLTQADGSKLAFKRDKPGDNFALAVPMPPGKKLKAGGPFDDPGSALAGLELADVRPAKGFDFPKTGAAEARYESFDGLVVTLSVVKQAGTDWARIAVTGSGAAAKQAAALEAKVQPWIFAIADYKAKALETKLGDVVEAAKGS
ncbi:MAG TPA: DUF4340 domain-containing protein [Stellaceae bacterium]|nr:DUF4340 domain-containing protein [Stellaceae bacterium]